jgi:7,8-dihydropterin-6-yl-methyl-4-(beta-D-ribofuranosyl)aminobenzene 5'-phosphate synthase
MKITTLIENRKNETDVGLEFEWGLSLHIAHNGHSILFDTGSSGAFADNAVLLSVNLKTVDVMVLSHHHFDHGGGLRRFFEVNKDAKVYLAGEANTDCYIRRFKVFKKYIGLDKSLISENPTRFIFVRKVTEILPNVFIFPKIASNRPKPIGNKRLYLKNNGKLNPDTFDHEIVMAIKDAGKLVVFTGCSHNGILNMIDTAANHFEGIPIKAVIGGFHLVSSPPFNFVAGRKSEIEDLAKSILDYPVDMTYTGHCTGTKAFTILKSVMGSQIADIKTGSVFEI